MSPLAREVSRRPGLIKSVAYWTGAIAREVLAKTLSVFIRVNDLRTHTLYKHGRCGSVAEENVLRPDLYD